MTNSNSIEQQAIAYDAERARRQAILELTHLIEDAQIALHRIEKGNSAHSYLSAVAGRADSAIAQFEALQKTGKYFNKSDRS